MQYSVGGILRIFSTSRADNSVYLPCINHRFFQHVYQFLRTFRPHLSLFFVAFSTIFFLSSCSFNLQSHMQILVKTSSQICLLQFVFLFIFALCYCTQSMSVILSCVHHLLISPVWCQQQCVFVSNQPCMVRLTLIDFNFDELHYYSFLISLDKCDKSCNAIEGPFGHTHQKRNFCFLWLWFGKIFVPNRIEDVNLNL